MRVFIKQNGRKYKFLKDKEDEEPLWTAFWDSKWKTGVFSKISDSKEVLVTIEYENQPPFWRANKTTYRITVHQLHQKVIVKTVSHLRGCWTFVFNENKYDYFEHSGRKMSLYKNDVQVAKYKMGTVHAWERDFGFVIANSDENVLLLIALFLMLDMGQINDADVTLDLGNVFGGVKEWNEYWLPAK